MQHMPRYPDFQSFCIGQAPETLNPTFPMGQLSICLSLDPPHLVNTHIF